MTKDSQQRLTALLAASALVALGAAAPTQGSTTVGHARVWFAKPPLVGIISPRAAGGSYTLRVIIRTRHALPRTKTGAVYAYATVEGDAPSDPGNPRIETLDNVHHCYGDLVADQDGNTKALKHPRVSQLVTVRLHVRSSAIIDTRVRLIADPTSNSAQPAPVSRYLARLGCSTYDSGSRRR